MVSSDFSCWVALQLSYTVIPISRTWISLLAILSFIVTTGVTLIVAFLVGVLLFSHTRDFVCTFETFKQHAQCIATYSDSPAVMEVVVPALITGVVFSFSLTLLHVYACSTSNTKRQWLRLSILVFVFFGLNFLR